MNLETVYIVRHGIAEERSSTGLDEHRHLTSIGIEKKRQAALGLQRSGVAPDLILTSPLFRAEETARIIAEVLGGVTTRETETLCPGVDYEQLVREAMKPPKPARVMFVGHQPDLGLFASWLICGRPETVFLPFRKAGAACLEMAGAPGRVRATLQWFVAPSQLRAIGSAPRTD